MKKVRKMVMLFTLGVICILTGCYAEETPVATKQPENEYISDMKKGTIGSTGIKLGEAFNSFFVSPSYKYFVSNDERKIIECVGYCRVNDIQTQVTMQFAVSNACNTQNPVINGVRNTYEMIYMEYNGITWGNYIMLQTMETIVDSYRRSPKSSNSY